MIGSTTPRVGEGEPGAPEFTGMRRGIAVFVFGLALSLFFVLTYTLCILAYLFLPEVAIQHSAMSLFLPGFKLLTWQSYVLGLAETFAYGWYIALVFGSIYNALAKWLG